MSHGVQAQEDTSELLNYAYSTVLGTGWYKVGDRQVAVFEAPFSWTYREGTQEEVGVRWLLPVTVGLHNFSADTPIPDVDDVGTLSVLPGFELDFRLKSGWRLRPYAQLGGAWDLAGSERATVYVTGIRTRYEIAVLTPETVGVTWGTKALISGYRPENGNDDSLGLVAFGMDFRWPTRLRLGDRLTFIGASVYANLYFNRARFSNIVDDADSVASEYTVMLGLGGSPDFRILGIPFERAAVGYKYGRNIRAVTLGASFPF